MASRAAAALEICVAGQAVSRPPMASGLAKLRFRSAVESASIGPLWAIGDRKRPIAPVTGPFVVVEPASEVRLSGHSGTVRGLSGLSGSREVRGHFGTAGVHLHASEDC